MTYRLLIFLSIASKLNRLSIRIPEVAYREGLECYRNNLRERLITRKGNIPLEASESRDKLIKLWSPITNWDLIPLRYGYFEIFIQIIGRSENCWSVRTSNISHVLHVYGWPFLAPTFFLKAALWYYAYLPGKNIKSLIISFKNMVRIFMITSF